MTIKIGEKFPETTFSILENGEPKEVTSGDLFLSRKVVVFAVPGAFTPTCNMNHLPGYLDSLSSMKSKGVDDVYVISVNDPWVMEAWANATNARGKIGFLADGSCKATATLGMELDLDAIGLGKRSLRYSVILENGIVKSLNVEEDPTKAETSGAETILQQL